MPLAKIVKKNDEEDDYEEEIKRDLLRLLRQKQTKIKKMKDCIRKVSL